MKRSKITLLLILMTFAFCLPAHAEDIAVSALVDKTELDINDVIYLSVSVKGISSADNMPVISHGADFDVSYRGASSNFTMINGAVSSNVDFNYTLEPKKVGTFVLDNIALRHEGKVYKTDPITIKVSESEKGGTEQDIFAVASVSDTSPFVNEQVIFTFKLYVNSATQVANPSFNNPDFSNFVYEELGAARRFREMVRGQSYIVNEVNYALFPLKSGEYIIPSIRVSLDKVRPRGRSRGILGGFNDYVAKRLRTNEVKLSVRPLPRYDIKGVPFSNFIGKFSIQSSLRNRTIKVGESTTLTVTVTGLGNLKDSFMLPHLDSADFKVYDDKPSENIRAGEGGVYGSKVYKRAFIPLKKGTLTIPSVKMAYFDTDREDYIVLRSEEYQITVKPSTEKEELNLVELAGTTTTKEAVRIIGQDILPIKTSLDSLKNNDLFHINWFFLILLSIVPGALYLALFVYVKKNDRFRSDESLMRRKRAYKEFTKSASGLDKLAAGDGGQFLEKLLTAFKAYMGDRFNLVGGALTIDEIAKVLTERGFDKALVDGVRESAGKLEAAKFSNNGLDEIEKSRLLRSITENVKLIEKKS